MGSNLLNTTALRDQSEFKLDGGGGGEEMKFFRTKIIRDREKCFEGLPLFWQVYFKSIKCVIKLHINT